MEHPGDALHPFPCRGGLPWPEGLGAAAAPAPPVAGAQPRRRPRSPWRGLLLFACGAGLPLLLELFPAGAGDVGGFAGPRLSRAGTAPQIAALAEHLRGLLDQTP